MKLYLAGRSEWDGDLLFGEFVLARSCAEARMLYRQRIYKKGREVPRQIKARELPFDSPRVLDDFDEGWGLVRARLNKEQGVNDEQVAWWAT